MTLIYDGGVAIGWKATNPTLRVEVLRAPDDGSGSPDTASEISLAIVSPPTQGYVDLSAGVSLTRFHYRVRHVFPGYDPGTASKYIRGHGVTFDTHGVKLPVLSNSQSVSSVAGGSNAMWVQTGGTIITPFFTPAQFAIYGALSLTTAQTDGSVAGYFETQNTIASTQAVSGLDGVVDTRHTAGTVTNAFGVVGITRTNGAGGTTTNARAFNAVVSRAAGSMTNAVGYYVNAFGDASITNAYGVYVSSISGATTLNYAIYTNAGRVVFNAGAAASSEVWIGHTTAATGGPRVDIIAPDGAVGIGNNTTNATAKYASIKCRHYTNSEETVSVIGAVSASGSSEVFIGGGPFDVLGYNAATLIAFYSATTTTTVTGTARGGIDTDNGFFFNATAGSFGSGKGVVFYGNAATNPSTNPTAGGILYSNAGAGTWRGSGGTVTAFGPAGPHCGKCGYDFWEVASHNESWGASLRKCGWCGATYKHGPESVLDQLTEEQRAELVYA